MLVYFVVSILQVGWSLAQCTLVSSSQRRHRSRALPSGLSKTATEEENARLPGSRKNFLSLQVHSQGDNSPPRRSKKLFPAPFVSPPSVHRYLNNKKRMRPPEKSDKEKGDCVPSSRNSCLSGKAGGGDDGGLQSGSGPGGVSRSSIDSRLSTISVNGNENTCRSSLTKTSSPVVGFPSPNVSDYLDCGSPNEKRGVLQFPYSLEGGKDIDDFDCRDSNRPGRARQSALSAVSGDVNVVFPGDEVGELALSCRDNMKYMLSGHVNRSGVFSANGDIDPPLLIDSTEFSGTTRSAHEAKQEQQEEKAKERDGSDSKSSVLSVPITKDNSTAVAVPATINVAAPTDGEDIGADLSLRMPQGFSSAAIRAPGNCAAFRENKQAACGDSWVAPRDISMARERDGIYRQTDDERRKLGHGLEKGYKENKYDYINYNCNDSHNGYNIHDNNDGHDNDNGYQPKRQMLPQPLPLQKVFPREALIPRASLVSLFVVTTNDGSGTTTTHHPPSSHCKTKSTEDGCRSPRYELKDLVVP